MSESATRPPSLCVFCGSQPGTRPEYREAARLVGQILASDCVRLVYGGGRVGLMGVVADAVLEGGGSVLGVIPDPLATKELVHEGCTELVVVRSMHERKARMADEATAFLALPGGVGTFEEFFEILTWGVLGLHRKPIGLLNVAGYYDPLLQLLDHAVAERFVRPEHRALVEVGTDPVALVRRLPHASAPATGPQWIKPSQS